MYRSAIEQLKKRTNSKDRKPLVEYAPACAVRASLKKYGVTDGLYSVPLYLIGGLAGILG